MSTTRAGRLLVTIVAAAAQASGCATEAGEEAGGTRPAGQSAGGDTASEGQETSGAGAPAQDVYAVGDVAHTGVFDVTVHQVVGQVYCALVPT